MANLVIVESPSKAKTLKNYLGASYVIMASKGHIRDPVKVLENSIWGVISRGISAWHGGGGCQALPDPVEAALHVFLDTL